MKKNKDYPSVTVCMISYNDEKIIEDCLKSIRTQDYQGRIEILMVDGGSTDQTLAIAKKYHADVILRPDLKEQAYKRGEIALQSVKTELAVFFSADNRFQEKDCLRRMIEPFTDSEIAAVETWRYGFRENDSLLTKYFALIGGGDPIAVALGKADRAPYDATRWHSFGKAEDEGSYYKVIFEPDLNKIPTLGFNGFAIRTSLAQKFPNTNALNTDMCVEMIKRGYNRFAFIKDKHIIHKIDNNILSFLQRKIIWFNAYSPIRLRRKYLVYDPKHDQLKLIFIILFFSTFLIPVIKAIKGYFRYRHRAWFLNPLICFIFVINYGVNIVWSFIKQRFKQFSNKQ